MRSNSTIFPVTILLIVKLIQLTVVFGAPAENVEPGLLVVSFDGFRAEYLNRNLTPNLNKFRSDGISTSHMLSVFPTKTFVNHHSIATVK